MIGRLIAALWVGFVCCAAASGADLKKELDVPYGEHKLQKIDVYMPAESDGPRPAVIWIHGGGWREGDKALPPNGISTFADALVEKGYVAFSCNYRLLPEHHHPAQIDDVQRVVRWVRANAEKYGVDPKRVGVAGISAGGHLSCLLAMRDTREKQGDDLDKFSSKPDAAVSLNGPTDLRDGSEFVAPAVRDLVRKFIDPEAKNPDEEIADASPMAFVSKEAAPLLLICGDKDNLVPYGSSVSLHKELLAKGADAELLILPGAGHGIFPSITPEARDAAIVFFEKYLKGKAK